MFLLVLLVLFCANGIVFTQYSFLDILPTDYNRDLAPTLDRKPVRVNVSLVVLTLKPDPNAQMSFTIDFFYQLYWIDHRLRAPADKKITLGPQWKDKLWLPDAYFRNSISGGIPQLFSQNIYFAITKGKSVFMAARIQMKLNCDMNFIKFPFDRQICYINITTLSQTAESVRLEWETHTGFRIGTHVQLPEYSIVNKEYHRCTKTFKNIGNYSCLYVTIRLNRNFGKYLIKRFIPSTLIVIMTFIGFWIPTQVTPARVALIITALLALIAQQIQGELNISYIYALEVFTIICIIFVFATLIEYAIAISWKDKQNNNLQQNSIDNNNRKTKRWATFVTPNERNCSVDMVSRTIFPVAFILTIIIYTLCYYFS